MKTRLFNLFAISLLVLVFFTVEDTSAQRFRSQGGILGWADDNHYLERTTDDEGNRVVMSVHIRTGKKKPYEDYINYREKFMSSLPEGFTMGYSTVMSPDNKYVILQKDNNLWLFGLGDKEAKQLTHDPGEENNPHFSPDGKKLAYTKGRELYVYDLVKGKEKRLTFDAGNKIYNGYASWVYMEEILGRGSHYAAFWWSPDSRKIAYLHTDETQVPEFIINRIDEKDGLHGTQEITPYPKPGDPNPKVKMGIVDIISANNVWVRTDDTVDQYIAWPDWTPDSKKLMIQVLNRDQDDMRFILADIESGDYNEIYRETRDTWVDFFTDNYIMQDGSGFIIRSCKSDWMNLYYYSWDGNLKTQLTNFDWRVSRILKVDEKQGFVYFSGTGSESTESHIFRVNLDGTNLLRYSEIAGTHSANISPSGKYIIDTWSNISTPSTMVALDSKGRKVRDIQLPGEKTDEDQNLKFELVRIKASDGFMLPAIISYPVDFDEAKKYPVVFTIYGGPDAGGVRNRYMGNRAGWYAENGIITFSVDHRASGHFGKKGLDYMHRNLGKWEMLDYIEAVKWLRGKPFVDTDRIGITGGSYGGYTTAMALTYGADYWTHGIAKYSVTDWRLYDNVYTERFMDTPEDNPEGYKNGSVLTYTENLKGKLYIVHGMADDNVHMQNSIWLISKLQDEGKEFDFMIYPGGRHGWGGPKANHTRNGDNKRWIEWFNLKD
ncbi:MAG TPA: S9 family peptidase [Bacteroidales bacterium]|nr:S9 family peptidase [Bacteroidales bacterium]